MSKIEKLRVKISFEVEYGDIEIPQEILQQLEVAAGMVRPISDTLTKYSALYEWLCQNINERDSLGHEYEIIDLETESEQ